jgi:hypothetical protein
MTGKEMMAMLPPAPAGLDNWIRRNVVTGKYMIYDLENDAAVCTHCGHVFPAKRFAERHNDTGTCSNCKTAVKFKSEKRGRKNLQETFRILLFTRKGKTIYATLSEVIADFTEFGMPELYKRMTDVYVMSKSKQTHYKFDFYMDNLTGDGWHAVNGMTLPHPPTGYYGTDPFPTVVYERNLEAIFRNTGLKYSWAPEWFEESEIDAYELMSYISLSLKYSSIELLRKSGFARLVLQKVRKKPGSGCINWRGKNLQQILRLPMGDIRKLKRGETNFDILRTFQKMTEKQRNLPWEVVKRIAKLTNWHADMIEKTGTVDVITWGINSAKQDISAYDWCDYIRDCRLLGMDVRKKSVLFPENFAERHQELAAKVKVERTKIEQEGIRKTAETYALNLESENLTLKIARSQEDLNKESSILCHCVRTYGGRVAEGSTVIYFIRKKSEPDKPYYTLEIRPNGQFVQCRGMKNCSMTEEVKAFKDTVVKEFKKLIKQGRKTA